MHVVLLLAACAAPGPPGSGTLSTDTTGSVHDSLRDTGPTESVGPDDTGTTGTTPPIEPPGVVLLVTQDALNRRFYGWHPDGVRDRWGWDTTPFADTVFAEGVALPEVVMTRALTAVSLGTLLTGAWPRHHGVREAADQFLLVPSLPKAFADAGWTTAAIFSNRCGYTSPDVVPGWDHAACTYEEGVQGVDQQEVEDLDVALFEELMADEGDERLFVWVHLINPHDELEPVEPWYSEFHPEPYEGDLETMYRANLDRVSTDGRAYTEEDRRHVEATYASAVRANDARIQHMVEVIEAAGRGDELLLVLGADHGEELVERPDQPYFWHPCTPYQGAGLTAWAFRGPGLAAREVVGPVSAVDLAPTLLELAGLDPGALTADGSSLRAAFADGVAPDRPAFHERGDHTAGVTDGSLRYTLNPDGGFVCLTFDAEHPYVTPEVELYDLSVDPFELENLVDTEPALADRMRGTLCAHVLAEPWSVDDASNPVVATCRADPGSP